MTILPMVIERMLWLSNEALALTELALHLSGLHKHPLNNLQVLDSVN